MGMAEEIHRLAAAQANDPDAFQPLYELAEYTSRFRASIVEAIPLLLRLLEMSPPEDKLQMILERLVSAFGYAGDLENEHKAARYLADIFGHDGYVLVCAESCGRRGEFDETSRRIGPVIDANYADAVERQRATGAALPTQMIMDGDSLFDAFGELAQRFDLYVKARILGFTPPVRAISRTTTLTSVHEVSNRFLLDLWRSQAAEYVDFIDDSEEWRALGRTHGTSQLFLTYYRLPDGRATHRAEATTYIEREWHRQGRGPVLRLPAETVERGRAWLSEHGIPRDAWFVALHVREGLYKDSPDSATDYNRHRNARPANYEPAIRRIVERGGYVVRLGDPTAHDFGQIPHLFDYGSREDKEDWQDVFLLAASRFFVGNNSGPVVVAHTFGVPAVFTDYFPIGYSLGGPRDLLIHKLLRDRETGRHLTFAEMSSARFAFEQSPIVYDRLSAEVEDNTPEEIVAVVEEMLDRLDGVATYGPEDERKQQRYGQLCGICKYGMTVRIGRNFLDRHPFLLEEPPG